MSKSNVVSARLRAEQLTELAALAETRNCSRNEAIRIALAVGLPLANQGFTFNVARLLFILEHLGASIDVIMSREHADVYEHLETLAAKRMEEFHA